MQEQPEDLLAPSTNQSIDKPGPQENINMDGKSQETMHMQYNLIYTMPTTSGRKLLIWKSSKSKNGSFPELCIYLAFGRISFHLHYICISFAFRIAPRISIFALHFISI